jgi:multiple sugar transport system substrate-binding protein
MKRTVAFILMAALAASIAIAQAPKVPGLAGKKIEISLWTHDDVNRSAIEKQYVQEFMDANPGITVEYSTSPSGKILEKLTTAFAANQGPDIFNVAITSAISFLDNGRSTCPACSPP